MSIWELVDSLQEDPKDQEYRNIHELFVYTVGNSISALSYSIYFCPWRVVSGVNRLYFCCSLLTGVTVVRLNVIEALALFCYIMRVGY